MVCVLAVCVYDDNDDDSYVWDVTQDWGLGNIHKKLLNDRRMYGRYVCMSRCLTHHRYLIVYID